MCGNFRSYVPNSMFLGRENDTIAESLNPPASPAASSAYKRATAVLASSFPMMGPIPIIQMGTCLALGVTGKSNAVGWAPVHWGWWVPSLWQQHCPLCTPCAVWGWLTHQACHLHAAARASSNSFCSSKQRKSPPRPPTTQSSSAHLHMQEGDDSGRTDVSGSQTIQD